MSTHCVLTQSKTWLTPVMSERQRVLRDTDTLLHTPFMLFTMSIVLSPQYSDFRRFVSVLTFSGTVQGYTAPYIADPHLMSTWRSSNALDSYLRGTELESLSRHWVFPLRFFVVFFPDFPRLGHKKAKLLMEITSRSKAKYRRPEVEIRSTETYSLDAVPLVW
jgi:hypothetical protein